MTAPEPLAVQADWSTVLRDVLASGGPQLVFQPIMDLQRATVAGYECLSRFPGPTPPEVWFAQADRAGLRAALEANVLARVLGRRPALPEGAFLAVNVSPGCLASPEIDEVLQAARPLTRVVVELTEHDPLPEYGDLAATMEEIRDAGGLIALDDIGAGYAGLRWLLTLAPDLIKIDRHFIGGIDQDEGKRSLVEMLGAFAGRIDAWALAEGIERQAELDVVRALGVPLGQGYLLGRPEPTWDAPPEDHGRRIRMGATPRRSADLTVARLVEAARTVPVREIGGSTASPADLVVAVDDEGFPVGYVPPGGTAVLGGRPTLRVQATEPASDVALRAMGRPADRRWDPVLCVDTVGRMRGIIRLERLVSALAGRRNHEEGTDEAVRVR
jgi:EAL domain-containing protein (putative c-di-GMP-specific phosphodiesterase class I)